MLTLQKPSKSSSAGNVVSLKTSIERSTSDWTPWIHVERTQAPAPEAWSRCMTAISHSSTRGVEPKSSPARSRIGATADSVARMASSDSQALVAMQRPESRSATRDMPTQPGMLVTAPNTSSRMYASPASMSPGRVSSVVARACTGLSLRSGDVRMAPPIPSRCSGRRALAMGHPLCPPAGLNHPRRFTSGNVRVFEPRSLIGQTERACEVARQPEAPGEGDVRGVPVGDDPVDDERAALPQAYGAGDVDEGAAAALGGPPGHGVGRPRDLLCVLGAGGHRGAGVGEAVRGREVQGRDVPDDLHLSCERGEPGHAGGDARRPRTRPVVVASCSSSDEIKNPDTTKKTSTPTNPPPSQGTPAWSRSTRTTARARRPWMSARGDSRGSGPGSRRERRSSAFSFAPREPAIHPRCRRKRPNRHGRTTRRYGDL